MAGAQPSFTGLCFYGASGGFEAKLTDSSWDRSEGRQVRRTFFCDDPLVLDILRKLFEFLVSSEIETVIGSCKVQKMKDRRSGFPVAFIEMGRTKYVMTQSKSGSGAARLRVYLPFSVREEEIDLSRIAESGEERAE